jgi:uncharacterized MAPEG superfamily protein
MSNYYNAIQGASIVMMNDIAAKFLVTAIVRAYSWLEYNKERKARLMSKGIVERLCKAQMNIAEWSAITIVPLLYFHLTGVDAGIAPTLAVVGNVGYLWCRILVGYPNMVTISFASIRYAGILLIAAQLYSLAF